MGSSDLHGGAVNPPAADIGSGSQAAARLRAAFERSRHPMLIADDQRRWVTGNAAACDLLGIAREEVPWRRMDEFTPPGERRRLEQQWEAFLTTGAAEGWYQLYVPERGAVPVEFSATANVLPARHLSVLIPPEKASTGQPESALAREAGWTPVAQGSGRLPLTEREREVLTLVASGLSPRQVRPTPTPDPSPTPDPEPDADSRGEAAGIAVSTSAPAGMRALRAAPKLAAAAVGGTVDQCNNTGSVGGDTITCTVTVTNNFTFNPATPDQPTGLATIVTEIMCTGSAVCPTGGTTTSTTPVTVITQCNNAGLGGASTVTCTVTVTNNLTGYPIGVSIDSTVTQCQSPGAVNTLTCVATPPGNDRDGTAGPGGQSVSQCNGSGGAGGTLTCTVTAPPTQSTGLPTTITQCEASGTTGASTVTCTSTITNNFFDSIAEPPTPTTPTPTTPTPTTPTPTTPVVVQPTPTTPTPTTPVVVGPSPTVQPIVGTSPVPLSPLLTSPVATMPVATSPVPPSPAATPPGETTSVSPPGATATPPAGGTTETIYDGPPEEGSANPPGQSGSSLPFTGTDIRIPILAGIAMLLLGVGVKRRTGRADRHARRPQIALSRRDQPTEQSAGLESDAAAERGST